MPVKLEERPIENSSGFVSARRWGCYSTNCLDLSFDKCSAVDNYSNDGSPALALLQCRSMNTIARTRCIDSADASIKLLTVQFREWQSTRSVAEVYDTVLGLIKQAVRTPMSHKSASNHRFGKLR